MPPAQSPEGILVIDKPEGPTSHDLVARARKLWGTRQVGHAGTLDPMATGVVVLLFGEATKLSAYLTAQSKCYEAEITFGVATDTLDAQGEVTDRVSISAEALSRTKLSAALTAELERREQVPPEYSAIKVAGRPAHRRVRQGQAIALAPRPVKLEAAELLEVNENEHTARFRLVTSKGYYVRAFARDLAEHLGVPGHLSRLRRIASGPFELEEATAWPPAHAVELLSLGVAARRALPWVTLTDEGVERAVHGKPIREQDFDDTTRAGDALREPVRASSQAAPNEPTELPGSVFASFSARDELVALLAPKESEFRVVRGFARPRTD